MRYFAIVAALAALTIGAASADAGHWERRIIGVNAVTGLPVFNRVFVADVYDFNGSVSYDATAYGVTPTVIVDPRFDFRFRDFRGFREVLVPTNRVFVPGAVYGPRGVFVPGVPRYHR